MSNLKNNLIITAAIAFASSTAAHATTLECRFGADISKPDYTLKGEIDSGNHLKLTDLQNMIVGEPQDSTDVLSDRYLKDTTPSFDQLTTQWIYQAKGETTQNVMFHLGHPWTNDYQILLPLQMELNTSFPATLTHEWMDRDYSYNDTKTGTCTLSL